MGKGDRKSKRGKIWRGSNGVRRPSAQNRARAVKKARKSS